MLQPKITRVRWSAENVPYGVEFDEQTGTFSGTPEDDGEYTVPVTVETNYGMDTKDVKLNVKSSAYGLYVAGNKITDLYNISNYLTDAGYRNENPDTNGFYQIYRKASNLFDWYGGFKAIPYKGWNLDTDYWPIGLNNSGAYSGYGYGGYNDSFNYHGQVTTCNIIKTDWIGILSASSYNFSEKNHHCYVYAFASLSSENKMTVGINFSVYNATRHTRLLQKNINNISVENLPVLNTVAMLRPNNGTTNNGTTIGWLPESGTKYHYLNYDINENPESETNYLVEARISTASIGYRAIKMFDTQLLPNADFHFLSETNLLDNNPAKFTHGIIKDAWVSGNKAYVQTENNQLYEFLSSSKTWNLLGTYDIQKVQMPNAIEMMSSSGEYQVPEPDHVFILTKDGKLFHKGNVIAGVFNENHETLTHVFPTLTVKDFTFGAGPKFGNILAVLKE